MHPLKNDKLTKAYILYVRDKLVITCLLRTI